MKHKYVITVIRKDTLLYVFGPYTSKKAAKADLAEKTRREAYDQDEYEITRNTGWIFRNGEILKRVDIERMMPAPKA